MSNHSISSRSWFKIILPPPCSHYRSKYHLQTTALRDSCLTKSVSLSIIIGKQESAQGRSLMQSYLQGKQAALLSFCFHTYPVTGRYNSLPLQTSSYNIIVPPSDPCHRLSPDPQSFKAYSLYFYISILDTKIVSLVLFLDMKTYFITYSLSLAPTTLS